MNNIFTLQPLKGKNQLLQCEILGANWIKKIYNLTPTLNGGKIGVIHESRVTFSHLQKIWYCTLIPWDGILEICFYPENKDLITNHSIDVIKGELTRTWQYLD
jgi:hypothetical protein